ncbi:hypothetical protein KUA24_41 [Vibrio phage HNL01]|nr:hypothetical protein KUA24_41 [Vibrio phage HNL01]
MTDIYLDPLTGDIDWEQPIRFCTKPEEYVQRIRLAWMLNLGEFFTHINYGLPWIKSEDSPEDIRESLRYFLGDTRFPNPEQFISAEIDEYTLSLPFVTEVDSSFEFDRSERVYKYSANISTVDGGVVSIPPYILNF